MNSIQLHTNTRRDFLKITAMAGAAAVLSPLLKACCTVPAALSEDNRDLRNIPVTIKNILYAAHQAPSGHNTQPWEFHAEDNCINIYPDFSRRLPFVDPEDRELYMSIGCALENLLIAAQTYGFSYVTEYFPNGSDFISVRLQETAPKTHPLYSLIYKRQCTRNKYNGNKVSDLNIRSLTGAAKGNGISCYLITGSEEMCKVAGLVKRGNSLQMKDNGFTGELKEWIRFSKSEADEKKDGLACDCSGNPSVPRWLGKMVMGMVVNEESLNKSYEEQIGSSSGIALIASEENNKVNWIEAGRSYERFALTAESLGIKNAFINQPVEIKELNHELLEVFRAAGMHPQLLMRFGYSDNMPYSRRRNLHKIIV